MSSRARLSGPAVRPRLSRAGVMLGLLLGLTGPAWAEALPPLDCVIAPSAVADVSTPVPGVLESVEVERSDTVTRGQVLARLASGVEHAEVDLARVRAAIDTEIHLGEVALAFDRRRRERLESLYSRKAVSFEEKDRADRDSDLSAWKLRQAKDLYLVRQYELKKAIELLRQKSIRSPIDGVVVQRLKSPGEYVEDQPILRVARLDPLYVEAIVPMELFRRIRVGMRAEIVPEALDETPRRAKVTIVDRMGDAASGTFGVRLTLPNPDREVAAGLKCSVRILEGSLPPAAAPARPLPPPQPPDAVPEARPPRPAGSPDAAPSSAEVRHGLAAVPACWSIGPLRASGVTDALEHDLSARGLRVARHGQAESDSSGYVVLSLPGLTPEETHRLRGRIRDLGVRDALMMGRGAYAGRIALGAYKGPRMAERRRRQLAALGLEAVVERFTGTRRGEWLEVESPRPDPAGTELRQGLARAALDPKVRATDCAARLAAEP